MLCLLQVKTTLLVSLAWMIFNMIPPYLLLHYQFVGRGTTLKIACKYVPAAAWHPLSGCCLAGDRLQMRAGLIPISVLLVLP